MSRGPARSCMRGKARLRAMLTSMHNHLSATLSMLAAISFVATPGFAQEATPRPAARAASKPAWRQLFNGKDLSGWTPKVVGHAAGANYGKTFRVEDGLLKVVYDEEAYPEFGNRFGHLFYDGEFTNYRIRAEYRFVGEQTKGGAGWAHRNSGLMLHGQAPSTMGLKQNFPVSIEVQLLGGRDKGKRSTVNLCTPGTNVVIEGKLVRRHCMDSASDTFRGAQWVTAEVVVRDGSFTHYVNGKKVMEYHGAQLDERDGDAKKLLADGRSLMLRRGTISLQSESHPVEFRKVEILELPETQRSDLLAGGELNKHWHTKGNWKLSEDGVVTLEPREGERGWARFADYLWLKGSYKDFEIEFDYRVQKRGNSGFYFHVGDEASPVKQGIEVQIYDSGAKKRKAKLTDHDSGGLIPRIPPPCATPRASPGSGTASGSDAKSADSSSTSTASSSRTSTSTSASPAARPKGRSASRTTRCRSRCGGFVSAGCE